VISASRRECLTHEELTALVEAGGLAERPDLEAHIGSCGPCSRALAFLLTDAAPGEDLGSTARPITLRSAPDAPLARGQRVGRYEVLDLVGQGAMGAVYAAHDPELDRVVALKLLRAEVTDARQREELVARMRREARAMAKLSHPEVITVHDVGSHGDQLFVAMELVRGGTLRTWLAKGGHSQAEVLEVFRSAGRGLAAAHAAGLVHRDFKPDNVLIGDDGRVRVTDFGLARSLEDREGETPGVPDSANAGASRLTRTGVMVGTPAYMSPEQLRGETADARSDVFSFCVALHEAIYGQHPFAGKTFAKRRAAVLTGTVTPPPARPGVPANVRKALARGLRPDPAERPASMTELLGELEATVEKPSAGRAGVFALALVAAAAVGGGLFWLGETHGARREDPSAAAVHAEVAPTVAESAAALAPTASGPSATPLPSESPDSPPVVAHLQHPADSPAASARLVSSHDPAAPRGSQATGGRTAFLSTVYSDGCFENSHVKDVLGARSAATDACYAAAELDPVGHVYVMWLVTFDAAGHVLGVRPSGDGSGHPPALDRCMTAVFSTAAWGPTETGKGGTLNIAYTSRPHAKPDPTH